MTPQQTGLSRAPWRTGNDSGGNSAAVPAVWRKSSYSASNGGQCVEVARNLPAIVAVRDSTDPDGARLVLENLCQPVASDRREAIAFCTTLSGNANQEYIAAYLWR